MGKKNILTNKEAKTICERLKKSAQPSKKLKEYVHNVLLSKSHILFQYKEGRERFGYCTYCKQDFPLEIESMRTYTDNDLHVLKSRHKEKVICPCCGKKLQKRYAGISRPNVYADVAEFKVDENGALVVYVYQFKYDYSVKFRIDEPQWHCYQIGYFDIHKYFHLLYGWWNSNVYLEDRYTNKLLFTNRQTVLSPHIHYQSEHEGIKCFGLEKALQKSNLKYSCLMEYMGETDVVDMFKYLKFYCSYPVIAERLMKEGYESVLSSYLHGGYKGCFDFRGNTVNSFFRLDKEHLNAYKKYVFSHGSYNLKAMQFIQKNNIKISKENFDFLSTYIEYSYFIKLLLQFMGLQKLRTYAKKQGRICHCGYSYAAPEYEFFSNYRDYINQCEKLGYNLNDKNVIVPANLFQSHQQLTELLNRMAAEKKAKARAEKLKKFEKILQKAKKKYTFTDGNLLIRPAESYEDLCTEGTALHHCVYTNYADKHIEGETTILFIRKVSEPDKPFYTMEYKNGHVIQCRTTRNVGATDEVKAFVEKWKEYLKSNKNNKKKKEAA